MAAENGETPLEPGRGLTETCHRTAELLGIVAEVGWDNHGY